MNHAIVHRPDIIRVDVLHESAVHREMVSADHNRCVFIKGLFLNPGDEIGNLPGRAGQHVCVGDIIPLFAQSAGAAVRKMGVSRQHRQVERLLRLSQTRQLLFGIGKQLFILKSPPGFIIFRQALCFFQSVCVKNLIVPMLREVYFPPVEFGVGSQQQHLVVSLLFQNLADGYDSGQKNISCPVGVCLQRHLHRHACGLCNHSGGRPGRPGI